MSQIVEAAVSIGARWQDLGSGSDRERAKTPPARHLPHHPLRLQRPQQRRPGLRRDPEFSGERLRRQYSRPSRCLRTIGSDSPEISPSSASVAPSGRSSHRPSHGSPADPSSVNIGGTQLRALTATCCAAAHRHRGEPVLGLAGRTLRPRRLAMSCIRTTAAGPPGRILFATHRRVGRLAHSGHR
jgi:hypothetical protein